MEGWQQKRQRTGNRRGGTGRGGGAPSMLCHGWRAQKLHPLLMCLADQQKPSSVHLMDCCLHGNWPAAARPNTGNHGSRHQGSRGGIRVKWWRWNEVENSGGEEGVLINRMQNFVPVQVFISQQPMGAQLLVAFSFSTAFSCHPAHFTVSRCDHI